MEQPLESRVESQLTRGVRLLGGKCEKLAPVSHSGIPDRLVILPGGRIFLVELKRVGGTLSPIQEHYHAQLRDLGVEPIVLAGADAVAEWLDAQQNAARTNAEPEPCTSATSAPASTSTPLKDDHLSWSVLHPWAVDALERALMSALRSGLRVALQVPNRETAWPRAASLLRQMPEPVRYSQGVLNLRGSVRFFVRPAELHGRELDLVVLRRDCFRHEHYTDAARAFEFVELVTNCSALVNPIRYYYG